LWLRVEHSENLVQTKTAPAAHPRPAPSDTSAPGAKILAPAAQDTQGLS
jgi:hypothetical protein